MAGSFYEQIIDRLVKKNISIIIDYMLSIQIKGLKIAKWLDKKKDKNKLKKSLKEKKIRKTVIYK